MLKMSMNAMRTYILVMKMHFVTIRLDLMIVFAKMVLMGMEQSAQVSFVTYDILNMTEVVVMIFFDSLIGRPICICIEIIFLTHMVPTKGWL